MSNFHCLPGKDAMGVGSRGPGIPGGVTSPAQERPMSEMFNPHAPATAYDHNATIVAVLELRGKNWLFGAVAPGLSRRTRRSLEARNVEAVVRALEQAKGESAKALFEVARIVVGFESGRDGFWIARALQQRGIEV